MDKVKNLLNTLNLFESTPVPDALKEKIVATIKELQDFKSKKKTDQITLLTEAYGLVGELSMGQFSGNIIPLSEAKFDEDGVINIKVIEGGWGSSGYYSEQVLMEGAGIYKPSTLMFWNHPTLSEDFERPERSLSDLAGVLVEEGQYLKDGPDGAGVYAKAKVFKHYREVLKEIGSHIGLSHIAAGKAAWGEAEGKEGMIIEELKQAFSVDFVTMAGAGGKIVKAFEAARPKQETSLKDVTIEVIKKDRPDIVESLRTEIRKSVYGDKEQIIKEVKKMTDAELKKLQEANDALEAQAKKDKEEADKVLEENKRLKEVEILRDANKFVTEEIKDAELPDITKERLVEALSKKPVIKDGKLETEDYKKVIKEAVDAEIVYLAKLSESGEIKGMGEGGDTQVDEKEVSEKMEAGFKKMGLSESAAKEAASGR